MGSRDVLVSDPLQHGDLRRLAADLFLGELGRGLVREATRALAPAGILLMPLKGVLLQRLVYAQLPDRTRLISDVDVLVAPERFSEAHQLLRAAGFTEEHWEGGGWQVALRKPGGALGIDLHRRLSRTARSGLTAERLLAGGKRNDALFGVEVLVPRAEDLFAHLVLHASLHWLNRGQLHHGEDFEAVPATLRLDAAACATNLREHGLARHALLVLSLLNDAERATTAKTQRPVKPPFLLTLAEALAAGARDTLALHVVRTLGAARPPGSWERRSAALLLAPSWWKALASAALDRSGSLRRRV